MPSRSYEGEVRTEKIKEYRDRCPSEIIGGLDPSQVREPASSMGTGGRMAVGGGGLGLIIILVLTVLLGVKTPELAQRGHRAGAVDLNPEPQR